jgi:DNA-directed RNA polymerase subunit RPC12/RpoP
MPQAKEIKCPKCAKPFDVEASRLQSGGLACPHCGARMDANSVNQSIAALLKKIQDDFSKARREGK